MTEKDALCDKCGNHYSFLIVAWGRELTADEKRFNDLLRSEGKAEKCLEHDRFFNKSFKKRTRKCEHGVEM